MASVLLAALATIGQTQADIDAAHEAYRAAPADVQARVRYLTYPPGDEEVDWPAAISWALANASANQPDLSQVKPVEVAPGIVRIDLVALKWDFPKWLELVDSPNNPYGSQSDNPLFIYAPWLLVQLSDSTESDAYTELQWGDRAELNRDKLLQLMSVDRKAAAKVGLANGWLEVESQVAINRERVVEIFATLGGTSSGTRDFLRLEAGNRPLDRPNLIGLRHDGEEWITTIPKIWPGGRGAVQSFFLANGQGELAREAPVKLVEDKTRFRGVSSIRYPGSCWRCHNAGYNVATNNGLDSLLRAGVELEVDSPETQAELERKWLVDLSREIKRTEEDLESAAQFIAGKKLDETITNWMAAIDSYDQDVDLERAGSELGVEADQLKTYLAAASDKADIGVSLAGLAHDGKLRRTVWEGVFQKAKLIVEEFEE